MKTFNQSSLLGEITIEKLCTMATFENFLASPHDFFYFFTFQFSPNFSALRFFSGRTDSVHLRFRQNNETGNKRETFTTIYREASCLERNFPQLKFQLSKKFPIPLSLALNCSSVRRAPKTEHRKSFSLPAEPETAAESSLDGKAPSHVLVCASFSCGRGKCRN